MQKILNPDHTRFSLDRVYPHLEPRPKYGPMEPFTLPFFVPSWFASNCSMLPRKYKDVIGTAHPRAGPNPLHSPYLLPHLVAVGHRRAIPARHRPSIPLSQFLRPYLTRMRHSRRKPPCPFTRRRRATCRHPLADNPAAMSTSPSPALRDSK